MTRTLDEIEAALDDLVPQLAAFRQTSMGMLTALGGTVTFNYDNEEGRRLTLDYESNDEKDDSIRVIRTRDTTVSSKWKQEIVERKKKCARRERERKLQMEEVAKQRQKRAEAIKTANSEVLHPITRDAMPELLSILEDIIDKNCRIPTSELIRHLYTDKMQAIIGERIIKDKIVVISQGRPAAEVFVHKIYEILEHADKNLLMHKKLQLNLTNRDKIIILRRMFLATQRNANQIDPLRVKATAMVKITLAYMEENYPAYDTSTYKRRLRDLLQ